MQMHAYEKATTTVYKRLAVRILRPHGPCVSPRLDLAYTARLLIPPRSNPEPRRGKPVTQASPYLSSHYRISSSMMSVAGLDSHSPPRSAPHCVLGLFLFFF